MNENKIIFILDFAILIGISFLIYPGLHKLGVFLWITLIILVTWGSITGLKPSVFRKPFSFLYQKSKKAYM